MRKVYYIYNAKTRTYDRIYPTFKQRVMGNLRRLFIYMGFCVVIIGIFIAFMGLPSERELRKENSELKARYKLLSQRVSEASEVLEDIEQRDDNLYRVIFQADPIPSDVRMRATAGRQRYADMMGMANSALVLQTTKKIDELSRRLYIQSMSFDELAKMSKNKDLYLKCIPAIQPISNKNLKSTASGYGWRIDPIYGTSRFHSGMDFSANIGTAVYATGDGTVVKSGWEKGYGNLIIINHGFGYQTWYAHLSKSLVRAGQKVVRGEEIGKVGNTGKSTGPHLHYEVHVKGKVVNPINYYFMDLNAEEYDKMIRMAENHGKMFD